MNRETLVIPEKKAKIYKIKKKYNNMQMDDATAEKINRYEIINKTLIAATVAAGILTAVDYIVPDPVLGLDEAALTAITSLLGGASSFVDKKIKDLAKDGSAPIKMEEVNQLTSQIEDVVNRIKNSKPKQK